MVKYFALADKSCRSSLNQEQLEKFCCNEWFAMQGHADRKILYRVLLKKFTKKM
jgi:hypothetical protein